MGLTRRPAMGRPELECGTVYRWRLAGSLPKRRPHFRLIDAFSGAGGFTLGFTAASGHSFKPVWANDSCAFAARTYNKSFGEHCVVGDIVDLLRRRATAIPKADCVVGGPPCQGFSLLNRNREGDPRKQLWRPFLEIVRRSEAQVFVMENVPQLLGSFEHGEIVGMAESMGFGVAWGKLCATDYGVAQKRTRAFVIGCRSVDPRTVFPPRRTHHDPHAPKNAICDAQGDGYVSDPCVWRTVKDEIGDLSKPQGTEIRDVPPPLDLHFGRRPTPLSLARYRAVPGQGMNRFDLEERAPELNVPCWRRKKTGGTDLFGRLWWGRPASTIRTEFFKPEKGRYLHPSQHRPITHREAARLQSFPDAFRFCGPKIEIARQIGNAVPPALAARIADIVYILLCEARDAK